MSSSISENPPDRFAYERACRSAGGGIIAGVDEAGRGPLAGPVVAAAVVLPVNWIESGVPAPLAVLNDSKQLSERERERLFGIILEESGIRHGIASIGPEVIDEINILQATHRAMNEALMQLDPAPDHVLVDGLRVRSMPFEQTAIVKGDGLSFSIAAASILAKVTRDRAMKDYDREFPGYEFAGHKGYGTARHRELLELHGPCPIHRRSFAPVRRMQLEMF